MISGYPNKLNINEFYKTYIKVQNKKQVYLKDNGLKDR